MKSRKRLGGGAGTGPSVVGACKHKQTPTRPYADCSYVQAPLEALNSLVRVKEIELSLSVCETKKAPFRRLDDW